MGVKTAVVTILMIAVLTIGEMIDQLHGIGDRTRMRTRDNMIVICVVERIDTIPTDTEGHTGSTDTGQGRGKAHKIITMAITGTVDTMAGTTMATDIDH